MDDLIPTSDLSTALSPAVGADSAAATLGSDGVDQLAQAALDQGTAAADLQAADPIGELLASIPDSDDDLQTITDAQQLEKFTGMRTQLRTLGTAIRELQPLRAFQEFGDPKAVAPRLKVGQLLYSPLIRNGQQVIDPKTRTPYVSTTPLWQHLDKASPGMPEQAFVDLVHFQPTDENGQLMEKLGDQYLRLLQLDPSRLSEYQNIDAQIAQTSGTITAEELAEIDSKYHAAYKIIPAGIRAGWKALDEPDQLRLLDTYKRDLDNIARDAEQGKRDMAAKARDEAQYAAQVEAKQAEYFQQVRTERFTTLYNSLIEQITYSTDATTNEVNVGTLCSTLALLLDPNWRFIPVDHVLKPLGLQLGNKFDAVLSKLDSNVLATVAYKMAGDAGQAYTAEADVTAAADQLMALIAPAALKIAMKQGAAMTEKAKAQADNLARATMARSTPGNGQSPPVTGSLPPGMRPGSPEATAWVARDSGFYRDASA